MKNILIRKIYLYLFALLGLVLVTIGSVRLLGLGLKAYVFTKADQFYQYPMAKPVIPPSGTKAGETQFEQPSQAEVEGFNRNQLASNRQREASESLAMLIIGVPLWLYHWSIIKKEKE